jgi:NAD(P)-dependent dehydrogenase (short-subunit alcohol dehydrogenase family)
LSQRAEIGRLFRQVAEAFGRLDILVNSAAIMDAGDVRDLSEGDWDRTIDTNLKSPFFCSQEAVRLMGPQGGVIVNIADVAGLQAWARYPVHSISKAGVLMLTQVLAKALGPAVRVNAVAPGPVAMPEGMDPARWHRVAHHLTLQRAGYPEDIGRAVLYLIREDFVTGTTLVVDGGALIA